MTISYANNCKWWRIVGSYLRLARFCHFNFFFYNSVLFMSRDKLTSDECIGTHYLPMSAISGQGEEGLYDICAQLAH